MRDLSATLLLAQQSSSTAPYLSVTAHDRIAGVLRPGWTRHYTGGEPDGYHAACMPADGSLVRARVSAGRVFYQRIENPGPGSDYGAWADLGAAANADVALCAEGSSVLLFFVDSAGTQLKLHESADNGATLGAAATVATAPGATTWLAAGLKAGGDACLLYSVGGVVYAVRRTGGAWGLPAAWTNSAASVAGIAVYHHGDWNAAVAGTDAAGQAFLWTCVFGDGFQQPPGAWSSLREVAQGSAGSGVTFRAPFLSRPDTYRLSFIEKFSGTVAYSRPLHTHTAPAADFPQAAGGGWREPVPFDAASEFGQAVAFGGSGLWLSTPSGVWSAPLDTPALDLTADVLECEMNELAFGGRLRLVLRNDGGRYNPLPAPLRLGGELRIGAGYVGAAGPESSAGPHYWIDAVERCSEGGEAVVVVEASNGWGLLERWRARRTFAWEAGSASVFSILQFVFAGSGLELTAEGASAQASSLFPSFTMHPGESALTAARRLLAKVPDVVILRGPAALLKEPLASEPAAYAYGPLHAVVAGRYAEELAVNRVQVYGRTAFGERFDWPSVEATLDRLVQVHDVGLVSAAQLDDRAVAVLRQAAVGARGGRIIVRPNCGQEMYDVVEVSDAGAGLVGARRRVVGLALRYSAKRGVYEQTLHFGGV